MTVEALVFEVFGAVVDRRSSVAREVAAGARGPCVETDGLTRADAWRCQDAPAADGVRRGELPRTTIDVLHARHSTRCCRASGSTRSTNRRGRR